jgi:hypothetical protein
MRKRFEQAAAAVASHRGEPWEAFSMRRGDPGRDMVWWLARRHSGLTVRELGEKSGAADCAAVGIALSPYESKLRSNDDLRSETTLIERNLLNVDSAEKPPLFDEEKKGADELWKLSSTMPAIGRSRWRQYDLNPLKMGWFFRRGFFSRIEC